MRLYGLLRCAVFFREDLRTSSLFRANWLAEFTAKCALDSRIAGRGEKLKDRDAC